MDAILETAKHKPAINQIELHPYLQHEGGLLEYHKENGITVEAYSPLTAVTKAKGGPVDEVYEKLAGKYGVTVGEVALRWVIDQEVVALTTSKSEERLKGWLGGLWGFELSKEEVDEISRKGKEKHFRGFWNNRFEEGDRR